MADSHPADALQLGRICPLARHILPGQKGISCVTTRVQQQPRRWIQAELSTDQQERAARRQEWFHRMQWATDLTLADNPRSVAKGRALLAVLARSELATADDEALLEALNANPVLNELEQEYADTVDEVDFVTEDGDVPDR